MENAQSEANKLLLLYENDHCSYVPNLGPLHMSPVDLAGSVSEISPRRSFLYKISMCSYEKAGWPGYRELGNRVGNFPI